MTPQVRRLQQVRVRFRQADRDIEGAFAVVDTTAPWLELECVESGAAPDVDTIVEIHLGGASFRATVQRRVGSRFAILRPVLLELESDDGAFEPAGRRAVRVDLDQR